MACSVVVLALTVVQVDVAVFVASFAEPPSKVRSDASGNE